MDAKDFAGLAMARERDEYQGKMREWRKSGLEARKRGERVFVHPEAGAGQVHLWNSHHRAWLPWSDKDVVHTPQWKTFVANAAAKHPSDRSDNEQRAVKWAMEHDVLEEKQGAAVRDDERN
jgi:hypothetical protein